MASCITATSSLIAFALTFTLCYPWGWHISNGEGNQHYWLGLYLITVEPAPDPPVAANTTTTTMTSSNTTSNTTSETTTTATASDVIVRRLLDQDGFNYFEPLLLDDGTQDHKCVASDTQLPCGTHLMFSVRSIACTEDSDQAWCDKWTRLAFASMVMAVCGINAVLLMIAGACFTREKFKHLTRARRLVFLALGPIFLLIGLAYYFFVTNDLPYTCSGGEMICSLLNAWGFGWVFWNSFVLMLLSFVPLTVVACSSPEDNGDWKSVGNTEARQSQYGMSEQSFDPQRQYDESMERMQFQNGPPPPGNDFANPPMPGGRDWMGSQGPPSQQPYIDGPPGWNPGARPPPQPQPSAVVVDININNQGPPGQQGGFGGQQGGFGSQQGGFGGQQGGFGSQQPALQGGFGGQQGGFGSQQPQGGGAPAGDFGLGASTNNSGGQWGGQANAGGGWGGGQSQGGYGNGYGNSQQNQGGGGGFFGSLFGGGGGGGWFGGGGQSSRAPVTNPNDYVPEKADMYVVQKVGDKHGIAYKDGSADGCELPSWGVCALPDSLRQRADHRAIGY